MAGAGADIIVCHLGLTVGGSIGADTALTLADCVPRIDAWAAAARAVNPRRDRAVPRRSDRNARRRPLHPLALPRHPRLLRRVQHGAPSHRSCADRDDARLQGDSSAIGRARRSLLNVPPGRHHDRNPVRTIPPRPVAVAVVIAIARLAAQLAVPAIVEGARVRADRLRRPEGRRRTAARSCCRSCTRSSRST